MSGFCEAWAERLKLVLDELFTNACKYGSAEIGGKLFIHFERDETEIYFQIDDEGKGKNKASVEKLRAHIEKNARELDDLTKKSGRGLALISALWADELILEESSHGGLCVGFRKKINGDKPAEPPHSSLSLTSLDKVNKVLTTHSTLSTDSKNTVILTLEGEVSFSNLQEKIKPIEEALKTLHEASTLILDCQKLRYFNSTFIGYLASWYNELHKRHCHLLLKNTNQDIRSMLDLVGLSRVIYVDSQ